jgi:hypothetical protein
MPYQALRPGLMGAHANAKRKGKSKAAEPDGDLRANEMAMAAAPACKRGKREGTVSNELGTSEHAGNKVRAETVAGAAGPSGKAQQQKRGRVTEPTGDTPEKKKLDKPMNAQERTLLMDAYNTRGEMACFTVAVCIELAASLALECKSTKSSKQVKAWFEYLKKKNKKALALGNMGQ